MPVYGLRLDMASLESEVGMAHVTLSWGIRIQSVQSSPDMQPQRRV